MKQIKIDAVKKYVELILNSEMIDDIQDFLVEHDDEIYNCSYCESISELLSRSKCYYCALGKVNERVCCNGLFENMVESKSMEEFTEHATKILVYILEKG